MPDSVFAFPKERKEPMTDARHVRNAAARFDQVEGVSTEARELAFANIKKAAKYYDVDLSETSAKDFGVKPQRNRKAVATKKRSGVAKKAAKKAIANRKRKRS